MWVYEKRLQYPINITKPNAKMASFIISQYGGPDGEMGASMRYLSQRYSMDNRRVAGLLTDIGTEELGHVEMICTMIYQLMKGVTVEEIKACGLEDYYTEHGIDLFPQNASGVPVTSAYISSVGNPLADISEDMAAEEKARAVYENLIDLATDEDVIQPLRKLPCPVYRCRKERAGRTQTAKCLQNVP